MRIRGLAVTAAWVVVVVGAACLGVWSLDDADGAAPLDDKDVRRALDEASAAGSPSGAAAEGSEGSASGGAANGRSPTAGSPSEGAGSSAPARQKTLRFTGGSATVACDANGSARLLSWSPAAGYHLAEHRRGPAAVVYLKLEHLDADTDDADTDDADTDDADADDAEEADEDADDAEDEADVDDVRVLGFACTAGGTPHMVPGAE